MKTSLLSIFSMMVAASIAGGCSQRSAKSGDDGIDSAKFVTVLDGRFMLDGKVYNYVGANFWYGAILGSEGRGGDRARLIRELDSLKTLGIDNLRVLAGGDGDEGLPSHIAPTLQTDPGVYNDTLLAGLDYFLAELEKRDMRAVIYLNNAWEWSGGFSTYLEWAGDGPAVNPAVSGYPAYMKYASHFVHNDSAKSLAANHVRNIVCRTNSITREPYTESPAIMSWQIANEPRPFAETSKEAFAEWIGQTASLIKELDRNHLVSIGSEGSWGCENDIELWRRINSFPSVDYATIHIWPYNWSWVDPQSLVADTAKAITNTAEYIDAHAGVIARVGKPLVLEEFGYPRDDMQTAPGSPTRGRDAYYGYIFSLIGPDSPLAGINFWGWGGSAVPRHETWQPGDPYTGDPAQEAQGLNSVFANDSSTIRIIQEATVKLGKL